MPMVGRRVAVLPDNASFEEIYRSSAAPWDIGRPQPAIVEMEELGAFGKSVLDVGCGTGENVLFLASRGHEAWGVDGAATAIARATKKAKDRKVKAHFVEGDALRLEELGRTFDSIIDSGLFHTFDDDERPLFAASLHRVLARGGVYIMLAFSEHEPGGWGPRRVTQAEIREGFARGWKVESIEPTVFAAALDNAQGAKAWRSIIRRL